MKKIFLFLFCFLLVINLKAQTNNISGYWSVLADFTDTSHTRNYSNSLYPFNRKSHIVFDKNNNLYTNGYLIADSLSKYVVKWNGLNWSKLGNDSLAIFNYDFKNSNFYPSAASIAIDTFDNLYAIDFRTDSSSLIDNKVGVIKRWNGTKWTEIGRQKKSYYPFPKIIPDKLGNLYALGNYYDTSTAIASITLSVSKWDGNSWSQYGDYTKLDGGYLTDIELDSNQIPVIAGTIYDSIYIVLKKWSGTNWINIGSGINPMNYSLGNPLELGISEISIKKNKIYAFSNDAFIDSLGKFYFNKYDGNNWNRMDTFPTNLNTFSINDLESDTNSFGIFTCGNYTNNQGYNFVSYWNDTSWLKYPDNAMLRFRRLNNSEIENIELDNNGRIYISGEYQLNGNIHGYLAYFNSASKISQNISIFSSRSILNNSIDTIHIKHHNFYSNYNFQWLKNGIPLNKNDSELVVNNDGIYSMLITDNSNGFLYSNELEIRFKLPINSYDTIKICDGDSLFFKNRFLKIRGDYSDTILTANNSDSISHLNLIVLDKKQYSFSYSICSTDSLYFQSHFIKLSGIYYDTIKSYNSCDSIIILDLTVKQASSAYLYLNICKGDSTFFNNDFKHITGVYYDTLINHLGCDSLVSLSLNVIDLNSDFIIHNDSMISIENNSVLNWINCSTNTIVSFDSVFIPNDTFYYALIVSKEGCSDTSACKRISFLNSIKNSLIKNNEIKIYPNPFKENLSIESKNQKIESIEIISLEGISQKTLKFDSSIPVNNFTYPGIKNGTYLLKIQSLNGINGYKILVKIE